jgi:hypothetical protein
LGGPVWQADVAYRVECKSVRPSRLSESYWQVLRPSRHRNQHKRNPICAESEDNTRYIEWARRFYKLLLSWQAAALCQWFVLPVTVTALAVDMA